MPHAFDRDVDLHDDIKPFNTGTLNRDGHSIYYEQCGTPDGIPVMFVHGGPGSGCAPAHRRLFDPKRYHVVLIDQRGSGRTTPFASIKDNTTQHLIQDMDDIRRAIGVSQHFLFGGSWGSTLSLAYGIRYPENCLGFVLRGIFLGSKAEVDWFLYDMGRFFPEAYERFIAPISASQRGDLLSAYYSRLTSPSKSIALEAARAWAGYENSCATLAAAHRDAGPMALSLALLEAHYFTNNCFMPQNHLLDNLSTISHLPAWIVQGRHDVICPPHTAHTLAKKWGAQAKLVLVDEAGHSAFEAGIVSQLMNGLSHISRQKG
ncbi:MAG: Proline iminopeptidase [Alphaproteobacteria bacterium UBA4588]|nr:MAG: Proline iminopeptidase [Alphaproteobacteria bacterium UBA4588]